MTEQGYRATLRLTRRCLEINSGIPDDLTTEWGTQSARTGMDTHLYESGMAAPERRALGMWNNPDVEVGYLRMRIQERYASMRRFGL